MILLTLFLIFLSFLLIGNFLGYKRLAFDIYSESISRFKFHTSWGGHLKLFFPKQYKAGYRFLLLIALYNLRIGLTIK